MADDVSARVHVDHRWTAASLGGPEALTRHLTEDEVRDITARALASVKAPEEVTRTDFESPLIGSLMREVQQSVDSGPGAVILSRLDIDTIGQDGFSRAVTGLARHLGELAPQSAKGDRLGFVRKEVANPDARGYQSDIELRPHTDFHEILGLASVSKAPEGGLSGLVSLAAVYDIIAREDPESLEPLGEGFPQDTTGDGLLSDAPMPELIKKDGMVFGYHQRLFMNAAARTLGRDIPERLARALDKFDEVASRDDVILRFMLEPGQIVFWHNFRVLHSRENFRDAPDQRRLILRVWINPDRHLPVPPVYLTQARRFDALHWQGKPAIVYAKTGVKI